MEELQAVLGNAMGHSGSNLLLDIGLVSLDHDDGVAPFAEIDEHRQLSHCRLPGQYCAILVARDDAS
jgi:hypothetical protein